MSIRDELRRARGHESFEAAIGEAAGKSRSGAGSGSDMNAFIRGGPGHGGAKPSSAPPEKLDATESERVFRLTQGRAADGTFLGKPMEVMAAIRQVLAERPTPFPPGNAGAGVGQRAVERLDTDKLMSDFLRAFSKGY